MILLAARAQSCSAFSLALCLLLTCCVSMRPQSDSYSLVDLESDSLTSGGPCSAEEVREFGAQFKTTDGQPLGEAQPRLQEALAPGNYATSGVLPKSGLDLRLGLDFQHASSNLAAVFFYPDPAADDTYAFRLDTHFCSRLRRWARIASVHVRYISAIEEGYHALTEIVQVDEYELTEDGYHDVSTARKQLHHLVLAGHGSNSGLALSSFNRVFFPEPRAEMFFEFVKRLQPRTVVLDSCLTGAKTDQNQKTFAEKVADAVLAPRLSSSASSVLQLGKGVEDVFASTVSFTGADIHADAVEEEVFSLAVTGYLPGGRDASVHYTNKHLLTVGNRVKTATFHKSGKRSALRKSAEVLEVYQGGSVKVRVTMTTSGRQFEQTVPAGWVFEELKLAENAENEYVLATDLHGNANGRSLDKPVTVERAEDTRKPKKQMD